MKHTLKVYTKSAEHSAYLKARFDRTKTGQSFEWAGHRWAYEVSSFDDAGDYDLLYRFDDQPYPEEVSVSTDDMTIRDYFAASAIQSLPLALDQNEQQLIATAAYQMADAMLRAREVS